MNEKRFSEEQYTSADEYAAKLQKELAAGKVIAERIMKEKKDELESKPPEKNLPAGFNPELRGSFLGPKEK